MQNEEKNIATYVAFEECLPHDPALPERNLLRAILLTAMSDLRRPGETQREATEFFMSEDESYVFSFQSICNHLDIDPNQVLLVTGLKARAVSSAIMAPSEQEESCGPERKAQEN